MLVFKSTASFVADFSPDCESALASVPYLSTSISLYHHDPGTSRITERIRTDKRSGPLLRCPLTALYLLPQSVQS